MIYHCDNVVATINRLSFKLYKGVFTNPKNAETRTVRLVREYIASLESSNILKSTVCNYHRLFLADFVTCLVPVCKVNLV